MARISSKIEHQQFKDFKMKELIESWLIRIPWSRMLTDTTYKHSKRAKHPLKINMWLSSNEHCLSDWQNFPRSPSCSKSLIFIDLSIDWRPKHQVAMKKYRISCSSRFLSLTMDFFYEHSMVYTSETPIQSIGSCRRWFYFQKKNHQSSLLPCLGKVYERCFLVYLIQWMKMNDVLHPEQSGFREKHSTATWFVQFLQHISSGLLQQTATLVIYVDFIKAFDQLWHDGLIYKLHKMNCPYELVIFIIEYLKNRKGYIEMNRLVSSIFDVEGEGAGEAVSHLGHTSYWRRCRQPHTIHILLRVMP